MIKNPLDTSLEKHLDYLKLPYLKENCRPFAAEGNAKHWSHIDYLARLIEGEAAARHEVWKVVGKISPDSKIKPEYQIDCRISPPLTNIPDDKSFEVTVPIEIKDGKRSFPDLVLTCKPDGKFETQTIHLGEEWEKLDSIKLDRDERAHTITINDPVQMNEVRIPYSPARGSALTSEAKRAV